MKTLNCTSPTKMLRRNDLISSVPQLVLAVVFIFLGWAYLDQFDTMLARGIVITALGCVMLNCAVVSMLWKAQARSKGNEEKSPGQVLDEQPKGSVVSDQSKG